MARGYRAPGDLPGAPEYVDPEQAMEPDTDPAFAQMGAPRGGLVQEVEPARPIPVLTATPNLTGNGPKWTRQKALDFLQAQLMTSVYIPLTDDEIGRGGTYYAPVGWNGWHIPVPKGREVRVPAPIAEIVQQSLQYYRTVQAHEARADFNTMLVTPDRPEGLLLMDRSPEYVEASYRAGRRPY
jgi:hypothetical protein